MFSLNARKVDRTWVLTAHTIGAIGAMMGTIGLLDPQIELTDGRKIAYWQLGDHDRPVVIYPGAGFWKCFAASLGISGFGMALYLTPLAEQNETRRRRFDQLHEDLRFQEQKAIGESEIAKLQLEAAAETEAHAVIAQDLGRQYFAQKTGIPIAAIQPPAVQPIPLGQPPSQQPESDIRQMVNELRSQLENGEDPVRRNPYAWLDEFSDYPAILVYGPQGSGKTSLVAWVLAQRRKAGHQITVLDPHREFGQWREYACVGDGMDYEAINDMLIWFESEIRRRYKLRSQEADVDFPELTMLCDEFTNWSDRTKSAASFVKACLSDIRKVNMHVIFISHARTLPGLGGAAGLADTRDKSLLELELFAQVDATTHKASPKLEGLLKYPAMTQKERIPVQLAPWMDGLSKNQQACG